VAWLGLARLRESEHNGISNSNIDAAKAADLAAFSSMFQRVQLKPEALIRIGIGETSISHRHRQTAVRRPKDLCKCWPRASTEARAKIIHKNSN
jgi:hypothetical protein